MKIESSKMTRRLFIKRLFSLGLGSFLLSTSGYGYARYIEPKQLKITRHEIVSPKLPASFDGIRIVQFSDTHIGHNFSIDDFSNLIETINEQAPDIIIFTGDLIDIPNQYRDIDKVAPLLKKLQARLGKYSIYGNHDHGGYGSEYYNDIMIEADFNLLVNRNEKLYNEMDDYIFMSGIDDSMLGKPDPKLALKAVNRDVFTILLAHQPDIVKEMQAYPVDVQLSGHSHGGQIQLPYYGPIFTPPGAITYNEGFYQVDDIMLYVNRGIGTTRIPFRLLSPPELTVFTLKTGTG